MCGRATLSTPPEDLAEVFGLEEVPLLAPHYNLAPTQAMAVIRALPGRTGRRIELLRWGLVPWWADSPSVGSRMINARADTLLTSRAFREPACERRCLVVVDGFYEWQKRGKRRQPFLVRREDGTPLALAGVWDRWRPPAEPGATERPPRLETCSIVTVDPQAEVAVLHDRMPLILPREQWDAWLDPERKDPAQIVPLLERHDAPLVVFPVSERVNSPVNDDPSLVEHVPEQTLFPT
jgi:putative SOS response-associated peptidase YedK